MPNATSPDFTTFDELLKPDGPVMLVGKQSLKVGTIDSDGGSAIVFPPSYAPPAKTKEFDGKGEKKDKKKEKDSVYNIDVLDQWDPSKNVCVLDSIPSQANRMEPIFSAPPYAGLIPQYRVKFNDGLPIASITQLGHRIADAAFRGTTLRPTIVAAFRAYKQGDASQLAQIAPTSLVFGAWDSRGTGEKVPRLINSIIRAFNVTQLKRSAQYSPPIKYDQEGLIPDGLEGDPAEHGLADVPSPHTIGGIQIRGDIRRDFSLNLELLRRLKASSDDETKKLQRYILSLALLAFVATQESTLRQGCQLLPKEKPKWKQFRADGTESDWSPDGVDFAAFATAAAKDFGVTQPDGQPLVFDKSVLKSSIEADTKKKAGKKGKKKQDLSAASSDESMPGAAQ
jgi:CRISPR-associated protein Csb1